MPLSKKEHERLREMYHKVIHENQREIDGTATRERVVTAMAYIMKPGQTFNNEIYVVLSQMLGNEPKYYSKWDMYYEAMERLYPSYMDPETESDDTDETIVVDLDELD